MVAGALLVLSPLAALVVGIVSYLTQSALVAFLAVLLLVALGVFGVRFSTERVRRGILAGTLVALLSTTAFAGSAAASLVSGLSTTTGFADAVEPAAFESAQTKLLDAQGKGGVRLELTEAEATALVQTGLEANDTPVRSVQLDFVAGSNGTPGTVRVEVRFKAAGLTGRGEIGYELIGGDLLERTVAHR